MAGRRRPQLRRTPGHRAPAAERTGPPGRSHAAAPLAAALLLAGLWLGTYTVVAPLLIGLLLLSTAASFLSSRVNPFSLGFYLTTKPSWLAIGIVTGSGLLLFVVAYAYLVHGVAGWLPR